MRRIVGHDTGGHDPDRRGESDCSVVVGNLPLVIPNQTELGQHAHIFPQGKNLPEPPLDGEGLTRCFVGATLFPVDFPGGGKVCAGALILGDVERGATRYSVTPISRTNVVACSRSESAGGGGEFISGLHICTKEPESWKKYGTVSN